MVAEEQTRYRIRFGKRGDLRYTSHLDLARIWERTLRRARVPLVYSQGFNPRPKMQLAAALPLGFDSNAELIDIWVEGSPQPAGELRERIDAAAPPGLRVAGIEQVESGGPALQAVIQQAVYRIPVEAAPADELQARVDGLLAQPTIERERRGKTYDLRALIDDLRLEPGDPPVLHMALSASQERGFGRPDEVLDALGIDPFSVIVTRVGLEFDSA